MTYGARMHCPGGLTAIAVAIFLVSTPARAHESRPAYLELKESAPGQYDVLWRTPVNAGNRLPVALRFPDGVRNVVDPVTRELSDSLVERRRIDAGAAGLTGRRIEFVGLQAGITDVLVRMSNRDGAEWTSLVRPAQAWFEPEARPSQLAVARTYLVLGIEHILTGVDHLLYVLAMLCLVKGWRRIVATMSAFTLSHSLTLTAAALGFVHVPGPPVEACIALSILFVAREIVLARQGRPGLTGRWPWVVAFAFGLLHGLGFAGALSEVGLPQHAIPVALTLFNVGVEIGQLLFTLSLFGAAFVMRRLANRARLSMPPWGWRVPPYAIGATAAFWVVQRIAAF